MCSHLKGQKLSYTLLTGIDEEWQSQKYCVGHTNFQISNFQILSDLSFIQINETDTDTFVDMVIQ